MRTPLINILALTATLSLAAMLTICGTFPESACAQDAASGSSAPSTGMGGGRNRHRQQNAAKHESPTPKADENAYRAALKSVPDKAFDPWQGAR